MPPFSYNGEGINTEEGFFNGPPGEYVLRIVEAAAGETKNGDPKVTVHYSIAEDGPYKGMPINYHTVTFFRDKTNKGAGIAIKFLRCIGEPWEGKFTVDERNWVGKKVKAMISLEEQTVGKNVGKKFPKILWVNPVEKEAAAEEEVPF